MLSSVIKLKYQIDHNEWSDDIAVQDLYLLPEVVTEYYQVVKFEIRIESIAKTQLYAANLQSDVQIESPSTNCYCVTVGRQRGLTGLRQIDLVLCEEAQADHLKIVLPVSPEHMQEEQFYAMLDDISYWIFFSSLSPVALGITYNDKISQILHSQQALLAQISTDMAEIERVLRQIIQSPKKQIRKEYYRTPQLQKPQDRYTLQWAEQNPSDSMALAFRNITSYDIYENQFIKFFLDQLRQRLTFLQRLMATFVKSKRHDIIRENDINQEKGPAYQRSLSTLRQQEQKAVELGRAIEKLQSRLKRLDTLDFLRDVTFSPTQFRLHFSLTLTQDFNYSRLFALYRELGHKNAIERLDRVARFIKGLTTLGVKETHKIYEYWAFFALYYELLHLHFYPENEDALLGMITDDGINPYLQPNSSVTLIGGEVYSDIKVKLYYERSFKNRYAKNIAEGEFARPDITMDVYQNQILTARFLFDAKYKSYSGDGALNTRDYFWERDFPQVAQKYQDDQVKIDLVNKENITAFLLHTITQKRWFENYGAVVQQPTGLWMNRSHRYGFIPVVPGNLMPLRTLLILLFATKLKLGVDICWACGSTKIRKELRQSKHGTEKDNARICEECGHKWWVQHCKRKDCGFPLFKGNLSFQIQHQKVQPSSGCNGYICPSCGQCLCGQRVTKIFQDRNLLAYPWNTT